MPEGEARIKRKVLEEMKAMRDSEPPRPEVGWDVIWVLSGPQWSFEEEGTEAGGNETRGRLITGFSVARQVTALRVGKTIDEVTLDDVRRYGPVIYFDAEADKNKNIAKTRDSGVFTGEYGIPSENVIIGTGEGIVNTPDQFKRFPLDLVRKSRKIVVVTDAYHLPRTERISRRVVIDGESNPVPPERLVFYRSDFSRFPLGVVRGETRKIPQLIERGWLPPEPGE